MSLTVITHTDGTRPWLLQRCAESVARALPVGAVHKIVELNDRTQFETARWSAFSCDEYIAFVDDDDYVDPHALSTCLKLIRAHKVGAVFTDEVVVDIKGRPLLYNRYRRTYGLVRLSPAAVHHLVVMRSECVTKKSLEIGLRYNLGTCWVTKAEAVLTAGAIHVPSVGYYWTRHEDQMTTSRVPEYRRNIPLISKLITETWPERVGVIPVVTEL